MNKFLTLSLAVASAIALEGCAMATSSVRVTELNNLTHNQAAELHTLGAAKMQSIGPVFVKTDEPCTVSDIVKAATAKYKNVSDLVNIRMEETSVQNGTSTTYSCKYSALAVNYTSISPEEYKAWKALFADYAAPIEEVSEPVKAPVETQEATQEQPQYTEQAEETSAEPSTDAFYAR